MKLRRVLSCAIATSSVIASFSARADAPLPVQVLTSQQAAQVSGFTAVSLANAQFTTAAFVDVAAQPSLSKKDVEREPGTTSATYAGVSVPVSIQPPPAPAVSAPPPGSAHFEFKLSGDSAQGWATMSAAGMPFLDTTSFGKASASGTASWIAHVPIPATSTNLYVQFRLPAAVVTGFTEENGPSPWQSRFRAELMRNGHPVWNSEAARFAEIDGGSSGENCAGGNERSKTLVTFGRSLGFSSSDAEQRSTPKLVTLGLGSFPPGQSVEVGLIVRTDTEVPNRCCDRNADGNKEFFCTRSSAALEWDDSPDPVQFWVGPPLATIP